MRVLFVTGIWDAPGRYRCAHAALQLRDAACIANVVHVDDPTLAASVGAYSIVVLYRVAWDARVAGIVARAREGGARILFDIDDLLFTRDAERGMPFFADLTPRAQREYRALFPRLHRTFLACSAALVSTPTLGRHVTALGTPAHVHPNLVHPLHARAARTVRMLRRWRPPGPVLGYLSGSDTHDADLASIAPALAQTLTDRAHARLLLVGWVGVPEALAPFAARIDHLPYVDWRLLPWVLGRCRATLAPAARLCDYTHAKSALKFFEAGACGVPVVASPASEMCAAIRDGENGWLANGHAAWVERLRAALDARASRACGAAAAATVAARHGFASHRGVLAALLRELDGTCTGPPPPALPVLPVDPPGARADRARLRRRLVARDPPALRRHRPPPELRALPTAEAAPILARLRDAAPAPWTAAGDLEPGTLHCEGDDPQLVSPCLALDAAAARWLVVRWRVATSDLPTRGQLFWRTTEPTFAEERSGWWRVAAADDTAVVDLHTIAWPRSGTIAQLRVDPTDVPGSIHAVAVWLVPEGDAPARCLLAVGDPPVLPAVDIVLPVYGARAQVIACVESVLRHATGDWRLTIVDDASPDPDIVPTLEAFAARDQRVRVVQNPQNLGVTGALNRGMRDAGDRDVLWLNSDTVVAAGFLERLQQCAYADGDTGIVSPLSNNATIQSVPAFCAANDIPEGHSIDGFAALVAHTSLYRRPELPTAVGFCLYVRAATLRDVGLLDEGRFGRGFGDDDDLCQRARRAGWRVRLADDVFVYHEGHASYGPEAEALTAAHRATIEALHPGYYARVAHFIEANPLRPVHDAVRLALRRRGGRDPALLVLLHCSFDAPVGGTEHHARDLVAALRLPRVVVAVPGSDAVHVTEVLDGRLEDAIPYRLPLHMPGEPITLHRPDLSAALRVIVRRFGVAAAALHHLLSWPLDVGRVLAEVDVPFIAVLHDFYAVCPSFALVDLGRGELCCARGTPDTTTRAGCLRALATTLGTDLSADPATVFAAHRAGFVELLEAARAIVVPSRTVRDRVCVASGLPPERITVVPYGYATVDPGPPPPPRSPEAPLRVAFLGFVSHPVKGAARYRRLLALARDLPVAWHVFGDVSANAYGESLTALGLGGRLTLHGPYPRGDIVALLRRHAIDVTVHLPGGLESFCYALSESWLAGVPAVVAEDGVLAERVRDSGAGIVAASVDEVVVCLRRLIDEPVLLARLRDAAAAYRHRTMADMAGDHRALLTPLLAGRAIPPSSVDDRRALLSDHARAHSRAQNDLPPTIPSERGWIGRWRTATAVTFRMNAPDRRVSPAPSVRLMHRSAGVGRFAAADADPYFILHGRPVSTRVARCIRFRLRVEATGYLFAQVYWTHRPGDRFCEEKSVQIPLASRADEWRDYEIAIDATPRRAQWDAGEHINHLRFDPMNAPGTIDVTELRLEPVNESSSVSRRDRL